MKVKSDLKHSLFLICAVVVLLPSLISHCSSINLYLLKDHLPEIDHLIINPDAAAGNYALYRTEKYSTYLKVSGTDENEILINIKDSYASEAFIINGTPMDFGDLFYEYHFNHAGIVNDAYIVDGHDNKTKLDLKNKNSPDQHPEVVLEKQGYKITTNAGIFNCTLKVVHENNGYAVYFLNNKLLATTVRGFVLNSDDYKNFLKKDKQSQESYLTDNMIELYETNMK